MAEDTDWRLAAELDAADEHHGPLERLVGSLRSRDASAAADAQAAVGEDVAITHDGNRLFAYASSEQALTTARQAIEDVLQGDHLTARITVSHWDAENDEWRQVDPPPSAEPLEQQRAEADAEKVETQTMVVSAGKFVRTSIEQTMSGLAQELGLECEIVEHPHVLTTQVAFTVTGPRHRLEEFKRALKEETWVTIRADGFGTGFS